MNTTFARALAFGAIAAAGALPLLTPRVSACDGIHDLSCVINPVERLAGASTGTTTPGDGSEQTQQAEPVGAPTNIRSPRGARHAEPQRSRAAAAKKRHSGRAAEDEARAQVIAGDNETHDKSPDKIQDRVASGIAARAYAPADSPSAAPAATTRSADAAWTASRDATSGKLDTRAIWPAASESSSAASAADEAPKAEIVDASAYNEIDRQADATTPKTTDHHAAPGADRPGAEQAAATGSLEAMAMMDAPEESRSWWQDVMPLGETSTIGQIFVLIGGLLTVGTVLRMFLA